jgi:hypothetical protein
LKSNTDRFGLFAAYQPIFKADKVCFVENLESFMKAESLLGNDYVYLHKYGRIGANAIKGIEANEVMVFSDYDFIGLDEYLRIKEVFEQACLFVPADFKSFFERFCCELPEKQIPTQRVMQSTLPEVVEIRELVLKNNRFLEQEILTESLK